MSAHEKCPLCRADGYAGFARFECNNAECKNYVAPIPAIGGATTKEPEPKDGTSAIGAEERGDYDEADDLHGLRPYNLVSSVIHGTIVPDGAPGYAKGWLFINTTTGGLYVNAGNTTSCKFRPLWILLQSPEEGQ